MNDKRRLMADQYIEKDWNSRHIDELAKILGVSQRQLNSIFIKYYGMSYNEKITKVRMENAAKLLIETSQTVKQIAEQVGYDDFGYFCRVFKKIYNITALKYRRNNTRIENQ